jgi:UPF0271 protein
MRTDATKKRIIVLDTSAFIAGFNPLAIQNAQYSVPKVRNELAANSLSWMRFNTAIENGKLKIKTPKAKYIEDVKTSSKSVGDFRFLSEADQEVLALALQLKDLGYKPRVVTDDYSIQNVADKLSIEFTPLMTYGIRYRFRWTLYCPACHRKYPADYEAKSCEICGTQLKRKPLSKTPV